MGQRLPEGDVLGPLRADPPHHLPEARIRVADDLGPPTVPRPTSARPPGAVPRPVPAEPEPALRERGDRRAEVRFRPGAREGAPGGDAARHAGGRRVGIPRPGRDPGRGEGAAPDPLVRGEGLAAPAGQRGAEHVGKGVETRRNWPCGRASLRQVVDRRGLCSAKGASRSRRRTRGCLIIVQSSEAAAGRPAGEGWVGNPPTHGWWLGKARAVPPAIAKRPGRTRRHRCGAPAPARPPLREPHPEARHR